MVSIGWEPKEIGRKKISGECRACNTKALHIVCYQRILRLSWFSLLPLNKHIFIECVNCKETCTTNEISNQTLLTKDDLHFKTPLKAFWGWVVVGLVAFFVNSSIQDTKKAIENFKNNPQSGAYFTFNTNDVTYKFGKIEKKEQGKIYIKYSIDSYATKDLATQDIKNYIKTPSLFYSEILEYSPKEFQALDKDMLTNQEVNQLGAYFIFKSFTNAIGKVEKVMGDKILVKFAKYVYSSKYKANSEARYMLQLKQEDKLEPSVVEYTKDEFKKIDFEDVMYP